MSDKIAIFISIAQLTPQLTGVVYRRRNCGLSMGRPRVEWRLEIWTAMDVRFPKPDILWFARMGWDFGIILEAKRSETRCNQIIIYGLQIEGNIRSQMDTVCPRAWGILFVPRTMFHSRRVKLQFDFRFLTLSCLLFHVMRYELFRK